MYIRRDFLLLSTETASHNTTYDLKTEFNKTVNTP